MKTKFLFFISLVLLSCGQASKTNEYKSNEVDSTIDSYELQDSSDCDSIDTIPYVNPDSLKIGQVWLWVFNRENPFEDKVFHYQRIIAIKDGYVQYIDNDKDTMSSRIGVFVVNITKVK